MSDRCRSSCSTPRSPGADDGDLEREQLAWLEATLAVDAQRPVLLVMHHPPLRTGIAALNAVGLPEIARLALARVIERHHQVRGIVAGHVHRTIASRLGGTVVLSTAGPRNSRLSAHASGEFTIRLAPGQQVAVIGPATEKLVRAAAPESADVEVNWAGYGPGQVKPDAAAIQLGLDAFQQTLGIRPLLVRDGCSLPIMAALQQAEIPTILTGFGLPDANTHSPNEHPVGDLARAAGVVSSTAIAHVGRLEEGGLVVTRREGRRRLMRLIPNTLRQTLEDFITDVIEPGAIVHTDAKQEYNRIDQLGYTHQVTNQSSANDPAHVSMPGVHRVASLVKRWVLGTLIKAASPASTSTPTWTSSSSTSTGAPAETRGLVFYRLLDQCLRTRPLSESDIVMSRRGQRGKRRGPAPRRRRRAASKS